MRPKFRFIAFAMAVSLACAALAQEQEGITIHLGKGTKGIHIPIGEEDIKVVPAFEDYAYMLFDACDAMGMTIESGDCDIYPMNGPIHRNAIATEIDSDRNDGKMQKIIVYDRELSDELGSYEGAQGVVAHELGHHFCGHLAVSQINPEQELEADRFAGAVMRKLKFSEGQAKDMATVFDERPLKTHPAKADRIAAIKSGWNNPVSALSCRRK